MIILFNSKVKKLFITLAPWAAVISVGCFITSFLFTPVEFVELKTKTGVVKDVVKTVRPEIKTRKYGLFTKHTDLMSYCMLIEDSNCEVIIYTNETEKIDIFGINNIIGHSVMCEYNQGWDRTNTLFSLSVNSKPVITYKTDWGCYLGLIFACLITGVWFIWALFIEFKKEGYFEDSKEEPRIFKK